VRGATLRVYSDGSIEDGTDSARQMARYRRLFEEIRMPYARALLVVNHSRPGPYAGIAWEDETGLAPVCVLPWQSAGGYVATDAFVRAGEALASAVLGVCPCPYANRATGMSSQFGRDDASRRWRTATSSGLT